MPPARTNGKVCYVEIPAIEIPRSVEFYQAVLPATRQLMEVRA
jgi:predicted enzyme related to lactoylglutathione lyase